MRHSTVHGPARRRPITRLGAALTALVCGVGLTACSAGAGPSARQSPEATSPPASTPHEPTESAEPLSGPVAGLTWADGTPVVARTLLVSSASPATGVVPWASPLTGAHADYSPEAVSSDGVPLVSRMATQELALGGERHACRLGGRGGEAPGLVGRPARSRRPAASQRGDGRHDRRLARVHRRPGRPHGLVPPGCEPRRQRGGPPPRERRRAVALRPTWRPLYRTPHSRGRPGLPHCDPPRRRGTQPVVPRVGADRRR